jgi:hypothetical protein
MYKQEEFLKLLPEEVQEKIKANTIAESSHATWEYLLTQRVDSVAPVIGGGFIWSNSPEGIEYWVGISDKYKHLTPTRDA